MKPLILISISLMLSAFSMSQEKTSQKMDPPSLVLGITATRVFSTVDYTRQYLLKTPYNGSYYTEVVDQSSTYFFQLEGEYRWKDAYVIGSLGMGRDNVRLHAKHYNGWANAGAGGSSSTQIYRDIFLEENTTNLVGSLEAGVYMNKPTNRFRIGFGVGTDFRAPIGSKTIRNEIIRRYQSQTTINDPNNPSTTTTSTVDSYDNQSMEWEDFVQRNQMPIVLPKFTLTMSYRCFERVSVSLKSEVRFLITPPDVFYQRVYLEFPARVGVHYHF